MPDRGKVARRWSAGAAHAVASIGVWSAAKLTRRPVDSFAILGAVAASIVIIVNALFLQSGAHPAPFFANPTPQRATENRVRPITPPGFAATGSTPAGVAHPVAATPPAPQAVSARRHDPIADLIARSSLVIAVQRVLSDFGYGQIKPSGIVDKATGAAIEKFEREHKLPITGRISDRLLGELAAMKGSPLQ